jgi:hypothetical protein
MNQHELAQLHQSTMRIVLSLIESIEKSVDRSSPRLVTLMDICDWLLHPETLLYRKYWFEVLSEIEEEILMTSRVTYSQEEYIVITLRNSHKHLIPMQPSRD